MRNEGCRILLFLALALTLGADPNGGVSRTETEGARGETSATGCDAGAPPARMQRRRMVEVCAEEAP